MNFNHRVLVLAVVVRGDRSRRTNQLHDLIELVHFCPVSRIEAVSISQVYISTVLEEQLNYLHKAKTGSIVQDREATFITDGGIGARIQ